jgi:hypothetical protein|tara:strand:+ start:105 stop:338 length:234 start_codon:yes stop_codon:yes gene_type:complete
MINLDQRYHDYLTGDKKFRIDGLEEKVTGYGYHCDGSDILGYYVATENHKLYYNMKEQFIKKEPMKASAKELSTIEI